MMQSLLDLKTTIPGIIVLAVLFGYWTGHLTMEQVGSVAGIATAAGFLATKG